MVVSNTIRSGIQGFRDIAAAKLYPAYQRCKRKLAGGPNAEHSYCKDSLKFREQTAAWADDQKRDWILLRLRFAVRRAFNETDYYKELLQSVGFEPYADFTFDDFAALPVLEREHIKEAGSGLISTALPKDQMRRDSTGGSSGVPTQIWVGPEEGGWRQGAQEFVFKNLGLKEGCRVAYLWGHNLDPTAQSSLKDRVYFFLNNAEWFDCFRLEPAILEQYHLRLEQFRPDIIIAYASAAGALAEWLLQEGIRPSYPTKCILTGAEKLFPHHKQAASEAFPCPTYERYGSRDAGLIGYQLAGMAPEAYLTDWANILVEPETESPQSPILVTKFHADAMPMIRYRIGDVGLFSSDDKPGHPSLKLNEVLGREMERICLPDGSWVHGAVVPHLLKDYPVKEYMLVQQKDYSVELKIVPRPEFAERHKLEIMGTIAQNLKGLELNAVLVDRVPRTAASKWKPVVSLVDNPAEGRRV